MNISTEKTKTMTFCDPEPIRSKIVIDNKIVQVNVFNYLGCSLPYEGEKDTDVKISKFLKITGLINTIFKPLKVQNKLEYKYIILWPYRPSCVGTKIGQ
jgi:hypothetical protein